MKQYAAITVNKQNQQQTTTQRQQLKYVSGKFYDLEYNLMSYQGSKPKLEIRKISKGKKPQSVTLTNYEFKQLLDCLDEFKKNH